MLPLAVFGSYCGTVSEHLKGILFGKKKVIRKYVPGLHLIYLSSKQAFSPPDQTTVSTKVGKKKNPPSQKNSK